MNLEKAIEILTDLVRDQPTFDPDDRRDAVNLGVEALKFILHDRLMAFPYCINSLHGETKH